MQEGLSEAEEGRLRIVIAEAEGTNSVEALKAQFEKTDALADLQLLVDECARRHDWDAVCEYGGTLFGITRSVPDAERWAPALYNTNRAGQLVQMLEGNSDILAQSRNLQILYCWALFHEGELLKARSELAKLSDDGNDVKYRELRVNLAIALGIGTSWLRL